MNIENKLKMILPDTDMKRITIKNKKGKIKIFADVHGMKVWEAKRFINNILNLIRETMELIIIHGYKHGSAIKEMLQKEFDNGHVTKISPDRDNMGVTHIIATC